jgi:hypothetical protein
LLGGYSCNENKPDDAGKYSLADSVPAGFDAIRVTATVHGTTDPRPDTFEITRAAGN